MMRPTTTTKVPERRCIATGDVASRTGFVRFVVGPEGRIVPDIEGKLPGRGLWVKAEREALAKAVAKKRFGYAARSKVEVPTDLTQNVKIALQRRCLDLLSLARRAGLVVCGFEKVRIAVRKTNPAALIAAKDGSEDGRRKIRNLARDVPLIDLFDAESLGRALGENRGIVHAAIAPGGLADKLLAEVNRLTGIVGTDDDQEPTHDRG
ncbi:MAG: RNA-binding protein [Pseudomonadota bacterium]|nr:RNA-binding protein [Pseudomonadota bacterium]